MQIVSDPSEKDDHVVLEITDGTLVKHLVPHSPLRGVADIVTHVKVYHMFSEFKKLKVSFILPT